MRKCQAVHFLKETETIYNDSDLMDKDRRHSEIMYKSQFKNFKNKNLCLVFWNSVNYFYFVFSTVLQSIVETVTCP